MPGRLQTFVVTAVAGAAVVSGSAAYAVAEPAPQLVVGPAPVTAGSRLDFSGTGFAVPTPASCEVDADAGLKPGNCLLEGFSGFSAAVLPPPGYPMAGITIPANVAAGSYRARICIPTCSSPWGGQAVGTLLVEDDNEPTDKTGNPPTDEPPTDEPPTVEPPTDEPTDEPGGGEPRLGTPAAPAVGAELSVARPVVDVVDSLQIEPNPATPESAVTLAAPFLPSVDMTCVAQWEGEPADHSCTLAEGGDVTGDIAVPAQAPDGRRVLVVCWPTCEDPVGGRATADVAVSSSAADREGADDPEDGATDGAAAQDDTAVDDTDAASVNASPAGSAAPSGRQLVGGGAVGLLLLAGLTVLLRKRPQRVRPSGPEVILRAAPDRDPVIITTPADGTPPGRSLRLRAVADVAPIISMEVRP